MQSKNACAALSVGVLVSSCTFERRVVLLARSQSESIQSSAPNTKQVTRYLVYNLRKRGGDSADKYFKSTELIAGVKDMRFQALMPDVLHWLGITKIDNMVSMSDMSVCNISCVHLTH